MALSPKSESKKKFNKKKKAKGVQKAGGRLYFQVDGGESSFQTTDTEGKPKKEGKSSPYTFNVGDESEAPVAKKKINNLKTVIIQEESPDDELSFSDLDAEYPDEVYTEPDPKSIPSNIKTKTIVAPESKSDALLKKTHGKKEVEIPKETATKKPTQQKKHSNNASKKKSAGSIKAELYTAKSSALPPFQGLPSHDTSYLRQTLNPASSDLSDITFSNYETIDRIYNDIVKSVISLRNNDFYMFAVEVATNIGRKSEYFIQSGLQEIFRIMTMDYKQTQINNNYQKQIRTYFDNIKTINRTLKTVLNHRHLHGSQPSSVFLKDMSNATSTYQKKIAESLKIISDIQNEMRITVQLMKNSHLFLNLKFFYSAELQALINNAMNQIENLRDDDGRIVSNRKYDPQKIIKRRPSESNSLALLCAQIHNLRTMEQGSRPVTRYLLEDVRNSISELKINLNESLSKYDDILEEETPEQFDFADIVELFPLSQQIGSSSLSLPETQSQGVDEQLLEPPAELFNYPASSSSGQKTSKKTYKSRTDINRYYVPKRYRV